MKTTRYVIGTLTCLTALALWGCGAGDDKPTTPSATDTSTTSASADLTIRRISPTGANVEPGRQIVIQFDRTMVALGDMSRNAADLDVKVTPDPGCEWRWLDTSELSCRLSADTQLAPATRYTVTVGTALQSQSGSHLAKPISETFTTILPAVSYTSFERWDGPTSPVLRMVFNMPVTADALTDSLEFTGAWGRQPARVSPYNKKRQGPLLLPVPGYLGALLKVDTLTPDTPLDATKPNGEARRVWRISPDGPLPDNQGTDYSVQLSNGLTTPLGPIASQATKVYNGKMFGPFELSALECGSRHTDAIRIKPTPPSIHGNVIPLYADTLAELDTQRCRPESASIRFTAPVPSETLNKILWKQLSDDTSEHTNTWRSYDTRENTGSYEASYGSRYRLPFHLKPRHGYQLIIPAGVKDVFGRELAKDTTLQFSTAHRAPFLTSPPSKGVLESGVKTLAPLTFTNLDKLQFDYQTLTAEGLRPDGVNTNANFVDLLAGKHYQRDQVVNSDLGIRQLLGGRAGLVWGHLNWAPDAPSHPQKISTQVTPWNVFAKVGYYGTLIWVTRLDNGKPVANAQVTLYHIGSNDDDLNNLTPYRNDSDQTLTTTTDAQGIAMLPSIWFDYRTHAYAAVSRDDAMAMLPLDWSFSRSVYEASHGNVWADLEEKGQRKRYWAVTSQGIYKPGSQVDYSAFVRTEGNDQLTPAAIDNNQVFVTITDPEGNDIIDAEEKTLSPYGDIDGKLTLAKSAPMGWYQISIGWNQGKQRHQRQAGRFLVTDFVPATFQVQTTVAGKRFDNGDKVTIGVTAKLHAGGPYSDADTTIKTRLTPRVFSPDNPATAGFSFGTEKQLPDAQTLAEDKTHLNHQGEANHHLTLPDKTDIIYGTLTVEASVASARGKSVANSASLPFASRNRFIGLRTPNWVQTAKTPFRVDYLVTDTDGKLQKNIPVTITLDYQEVTRVREKNADGDYREQEDTRWVTVDQCQADSAATPENCQLTPNKPGRYRLVGSVEDDKGRIQRSTLTTYVTGAGDTLWSHDNNALTLVPDKSVYQVGDTAKILVQNPFPNARALLTIERYGVLWQRVVTLKGAAPIVDIPVTAAAFPGAFVSVTLFSPRVSPVAQPDLGKPVIAQGYIPLTVTGKGGELSVKVQPNAKEYRPGKQVSVKVDVATSQGQSIGATRLVAIAIDQAVVDLLREGKNYFDPRKTFYAPPDGPDIRNYSLVEQLLSSLEAKEGKGDSPSAGGGDTGPKIRDNFSYSAFWNAALETDEHGHAEFSFKLPDNLTRWRIFVIAMSQDDPMGLGDTSIQVNLPLQVTPALPNQVRSGDKFALGFDVTNRTQGSLSTIATRIEAKGAIKQEQANTTETLALDSFAHQLIWLPLTAERTGKIDINASAQSGNFSDAVTHTLPVLPSGTRITAAEQGSLTQDAVTVPLQVPDKAIAGSIRTEVVFSPTILGGLDGAFDNMRDNPIRNWETRLSRAVLAADYLQLKPVLGAAVDWPDAETLVNNELAAAADFQSNNGGMAFWTPRNEFVSGYLSVYTALAFGWLNDAGYSLPQKTTQALRDYLNHSLLDNSNNNDDSLILRAGALAALTQLPNADVGKGDVASLANQAAKLSLFGKALLLNAAIAVNDRTSADHLANALFSSAEESSGLISFSESLSDGYASLLDTPLRSNCAILDSLSRYKATYGEANLLGDTPQKLMRWIAGQRRVDGSWPNSQENVFCTTATARYASVYETPVKQLGGQLILPGQQTSTATFTSRQEVAQIQTLDQLAPGDTLDASVQHQGQGRLYYNLRLHYSLPAFSLPAANAGMTIKRHYDVQQDGHWQPVTADTKLKRGDIVRVSLDVDTPTKRHQVLLTDPLPGAFEAVNRDLATSQDTLPSAESDGRTLLMFDGGSWPNMSITTGGFYHREMAFDAVRFHADSLPAGRYRLVYSVQVIAPGEFTAPAANIEQIYHPDVFGRGEPQTIIVNGPSSR